MHKAKLHIKTSFFALMVLSAMNDLFVISSADAAILQAPANGGTFTMNLDRNALSPYYGYFLSSFWNGAASDYSNPINSGDNLVSQVGKTEISALNQVFDLTPIGPNPKNQADVRFVKGTSADFAIDTETLAGVENTRIGMTGVQGFYAPYWQTICCGLGGGLVNGDFSVAYDTERQTDGRSGWYLDNHIYFTMAVYDFSNLSVTYTDANNWQMSGDLLMSPENGGMLQGASLNDVGDFCLGIGSFAGCGQVSAVPLPNAIWLFATSLIGLGGLSSRKQQRQSPTKKTTYE